MCAFIIPPRNIQAHSSGNEHIHTQTHTWPPFFKQPKKYSLPVTKLIAILLVQIHFSFGYVLLYVHVVYVRCSILFLYISFCFSTLFCFWWWFWFWCEWANKRANELMFKCAYLICVCVVFLPLWFETIISISSVFAKFTTPQIARSLSFSTRMNNTVFVVYAYGFVEW